MKLFSLKNAVAGSILGSFVLLGAVGLVNGQNYNDQYRQWQEAQREAQREYQDYLRSRSRDDYRDWQRAQQRAQREYAEYQRTASGRNRNAGYNTGYSNRVG